MLRTVPCRRSERFGVTGQTDPDPVGVDVGGERVLVDARQRDAGVFVRQHGPEADGADPAQSVRWSAQVSTYTPRASQRPWISQHYRLATDKSGSPGC